MKKVAYAADVRGLDADISQRGELEAVVARVGFAVARITMKMLSGAYGKRVYIEAGPGNNGEDARSAARFLSERGVKVIVKGIKDRDMGSIKEADLFIDGSFGVGINREFEPVKLPPHIPVLSVDVPSGLDADLGTLWGGCLAADVTATVGALKIGLLQNQGPLVSGKVEVALEDLYTSGTSVSLIEDTDVLEHLGEGDLYDHKWRHSVFVLAGSEGMFGAAELSANASYRLASGIVHLYYPSTPGGRMGVTLSPEIVRVGLDSLWAEPVIDAARHFKSTVIGPGLGRSLQLSNLVRRLLNNTEMPALLDADGIFALGDPARLRRIATSRNAPIVITPHEGEFNAFFEGSGVKVVRGEDRVKAAVRAAEMCGAIVLLKGSLTVVASPHGAAYLVGSGSSRLGVGGSGDVLSGVIGGLMARGVEPALASALGAHIHGRASSFLGGYSVRASDLIEGCVGWLSSLDKRWHRGLDVI
ncbi:NAD(P)H-hydrate epimerase [Ferrithrix thermotolerans DSM 19514]|jgi:hydroxyethylthiazole kinase-like uncharacterized protein yjeF|uniref:ADP-dependent (S)-NAD(P)H-hydrate dehydratase n=1 Tax=Ferrithrix thermotolerans DSM 19514 TaxID=1121881 RepID=A0A1M4SUX7_9ACTN|nr:NAD(P)H-hydrate dehydratase [Ferrithrix thermotolerans]SHE36003.1 NAD(P)H-hydrate epimerase [Ferrithrix thermotolerans DSM 19514]